jgi:hypothetical protein
LLSELAQNADNDLPDAADRVGKLLLADRDRQVSTRLGRGRKVEEVAYRLYGGRHRERGREQGDGPENRTATAVAHRQRAAIKRRHVHPQQTRHHELQMCGSVAFAVEHGTRGDRQQIRR